MKLEQFAQAVKHQITGGSVYQWQCFGDRARWLDAGWENNNDRWQASVVFDSGDQRVHECQISDFANNQAWCWRDPGSEPAYLAEAQERGVDPDQAWDDVRWQMVSTEQEILQRIRTVTDPRETIELELRDDEMLEICMQAHERDMTLNQYVEMVLRAYIETNHLEALKPEASMEPQKSSKRKKK